MRTRVKFCGITTPEDAHLAADAGADAVGLVFYPPSPRAITVAQARAIVTALPPFVSAVGLFLDAAREAVAEVLRAVPIDVLQFHGNESPGFCGSFGLRYIKAIGMQEGVGPAADVARYPQAAGFLLDSHALGEAGGTGRSFDWSRYPDELQVSLVLAGGLTPANVAEAVRRTRPWAVDCSSGVESAPGEKDAAMMAAFIREVHRVASD